MPRRKNPDGSTPAPKPRVRKKKEPAVQPVEQKMESVYDPQLMPNGVPMMLDDGMYGAPPPDYYYGGGQPPFGSPDPSSPYVTMPPQSSTPQPNPGTPNMMMRGMPVPVQPGGPSMGGVPPIPVPSPLEYRLHDVNRRLYIFSNSGINEKDHAQWWDAFAHEFFDDGATMTFIIYDEATQQPEKFVIGRQLIPRYFRTVFESGVRELQYVVRSQSREAANQWGLITFECDHVFMITKHDRPVPTEVQTDCRFHIEFTQYEEMFNHRIKQWTMEFKHSQEYLMNEKDYDPNRIEAEKKSLFCRPGMMQNTLRFLQLSTILEPMQELMSQSKSNGLCPRESLKRVLFNHHSRIEQQNQQQMAMQAHMAAAQPGHMMPPVVDEPKPKPARKRQRKTAANSKSKKTNASPAPSNPAFPPNPIHGANFGQMGFQDVMVVGEPSMMGGDYGEEDERTISRVENTQYDPNALQMQQQGLGVPPPMGGPPGLPPGMVGGMGPPGMGPGMPPGQPPNLAQLVPPNGLPPPGQPPQEYAGFEFNGQQWSRPPSNTTMITG